MLRAKSGDQIDQGIYHFQDKADRDIGLRFDLTVGMTRFVVGKKGMKPPIKLASYGGVWRYDEPQHAGTGGSTSGTSRSSGIQP